MNGTTRLVWLVNSQGADMQNSASSGDSPTRPAPTPSFAQSTFVYIKIPVVKDPANPPPSWEDAIDQILKEQRIGSVLGWGDSLGDAQPDGSREVAFIRIDVNVADLAPARALLQTALAALGLPTGTEMHYTLENAGFQDLYTQSGWLLEQPSKLGSRQLDSKVQP